jgi:hypothetical protein
VGTRNLVEGFMNFSLRDYIACKAMIEVMKSYNSIHSMNLEILAKNSYRIADAMMKARQPEEVE